MYIPNDIVQMLVSKKPNSLIVLGYLFVNAYGKRDVEVNMRVIATWTGLSYDSVRTSLDFLSEQDVIKKCKSGKLLRITLPEYMFN